MSLLFPTLTLLSHHRTASSSNRLPRSYQRQQGGSACCTTHCTQRQRARGFPGEKKQKESHVSSCRDQQTNRQTNCMKWLCKGKMKKWGFLQLYSSHLNETCILGTLRKNDLIRISLKDMGKAGRKEGRKEDALLPAETGQADFLNKQGLDKSTANNLKLYK